MCLSGHVRDVGQEAQIEDFEDTVESAASATQFASRAAPAVRMKRSLITSPTAHRSLAYREIHACT
jgi:hypothetical protein